jgi:serine/threonine protein kinase
MLLGSFVKSNDMIASSAHSIVWKGHRGTRVEERYAIKEASYLNERSSILMKRCLLEVMLLKHFKHTNIVFLEDVQFDPTTTIETFDSVFLVMPMMDCDLHYLIQRSHSPLPIDTVQIFTLQLLKGLKYIHSAKVLHRDLKPQNILVKLKSLSLVICDFGTGRQEQALGMSRIKDVTTCNYRSPEAMLTKDCYDSAIDMWSVGCILCQLLLHSRDPFFQGSNQNELMKNIILILGSPTQELINYYKELGCSSSLLTLIIEQKKIAPTLNQRLANIILEENGAFELASKLLRFNPKERLTASEALGHDFLEDWHDESEEKLENICHQEFMQPEVSCANEMRGILWKFGKKIVLTETPEIGKKPGESVEKEKVKRRVLHENMIF